MRGRWVRAAAVTSVALVGVTACSTLDVGALSSTATVHLVQVAQGPAGRPASLHVVHVQGRPTAATEWTVDGVDPASSTVVMNWVDGAGPECGEVNRLEVAERSDTVTVGLTDTAADPQLTCAAVGVGRTFRLHLQHPLAGRALLEPATGVNDGLPHVSSGIPPVPSCSTNATPADAPVGMPGAGRRIAPTTATGAVICRTAWPRGRARTTEARVTDPAEVGRLVAALNGATRPRAAGVVPAPCSTRSPGSWYAVYLTGPRTQVEVFVDEIDCATVTNGALRATLTPAIAQALAGHFHD